MQQPAVAGQLWTDAQAAELAGVPEALRAPLREPSPEAVPEVPEVVPEAASLVGVAAVELEDSFAAGCLAESPFSPEPSADEPLRLVGPVEAGSLEDDADAVEQLAQAPLALGALGQRSVRERLLYLEAVIARGAGVGVRRHVVLLAPGLQAR